MNSPPIDLPSFAAVALVVAAVALAACALPARRRAVAGCGRASPRVIEGLTQLDPTEDLNRRGPIASYPGTGRSNSGLKKRLASAARMIGVKPTTAP